MGYFMPLADLHLPLPDRREGKVRISWELSGDRRLIVTTDRLSAFDRVVAVVPNKGQVLSQLSAWWFESSRDIVDNHFLSVPEPRSMVVLAARPLPVEVVVRGALTGSTSTSLLTRYLGGERTIYGHQLPDGLEPHCELETPLITPTTKALDGGHDEPLTVEDVVRRGLVSEQLWQMVCDAALRLFARGQQVAAKARLFLADTKYEFGVAPDGSLLLIDEVHTPDSSRYWVLESLRERRLAGREPESLDKEPVRLALAALGYRGDGAPPVLPEQVVSETSARYVSAFERLTGMQFVHADDPSESTLMPMLKELV
jgi:phosphoribosylaminoimidazole-succinocarboxamide synthase